MGTTGKPELIEDEEYTIEIYPTNLTDKARYIGKARGKQVFENAENYFFVDNHWITSRGGVITHTSISSFSIIKIGKKELMRPNPSKGISTVIDILEKDILNRLQKLGN